jgi:hypothetical protein
VGNASAEIVERWPRLGLIEHLNLKLRLEEIDRAFDVCYCKTGHRPGCEIIERFQELPLFLSFHEFYGKTIGEELAGSSECSAWRGVQ